MKRPLRSIPSYDPFILREIEGGFCSSPDLMEIMSIRRILEPLSRTGSSGYGFPFTLRHLNFYLECKEAVRYSKDVISLLSRATDNESINETAQKLKAVNSIFQGMRKAFGIPDHGNLSDDIEVNSQKKCRAYVGELEIFIAQNITNHQ